MPLVYRTMNQADDGLPVMGENSKELGVRVPPNPYADVDLESDNVVEQNGKGMSVAKHWSFLRPHLIPKRLKSIHSAATGPNSLACYRLGEGEFSAGAMSDDLELCLKQGQQVAGNIVPRKIMTIQEYQHALASTREEWTVDEGPQ